MINPRVLPFVVAGAVLVVGVLPWPGRADAGTEPTGQEVRQLGARIQAAYGFPVYNDHFPEQTEAPLAYAFAAEADLGTLAVFLQRLDEELRKYPRQFFELSRLKALVVVKKNFYDEKPVEGLYNPRDRIIFIDFLRNSRSAIAQRHNIHHEFYHMMEEQALKAWEDGRWDAVNRKGFVYEPGARRLRPGSNILNYYAPAEPGFVSYYAMTSPKEDRAETFATIMVPSQARIIEQWSRNDPILAQKIRLMKDFVRAYCPAMDEGYWRTLSQ